MIFLVSMRHKFLSILQMNDSVLSLLNGQILNIDYLREKTGLSDQKIRRLYKAELIQQINELLREKSVNETAELMGYTPDAIGSMKREFYLPNEDLGKQIDDINVSKLAEELGESTQFVRNIYKTSILHKLNEILKINSDQKAAAKACGISYDVARKLAKQYKLPFENAVQKHQPYSSEGRRTKNTLKHDPQKTRKIRIGPNTRIITPYGIIFAKDLLGKTEEELKNMGPFLAINENNELVTCDILSAKEVVGKAVRMKTRLGADVLLGEGMKVIADQETGLEPLCVKDLGEGVQIMTVKSLEKLPDTEFNFFDLLEGDIPITLILKKEVGNLIINKLILKYGTLKKACTALGIHYRKVSERRFYREFLIKIYNDIGYPDITDPDFFEQVKKIGIGGKKAKVLNIKVDEDLLYMAGLIGSDGYVAKDPNRKSVLGFSNTDKVLLDKFEKILKKYFPQRLVSPKPPNDPKYTATDEVAYNFPLVEFINNLGVKGRDVQDERGYFPIFKLNKTLIAAFIRGLFDGDGNLDNTAKLLNIAIFDESKIKNVQIMLKKIGIDSKIKISEQFTKPPFAKEKIWSTKYELEIAGKKDLIKFIKLIGSNHLEKSRKSDKMKIEYTGKMEISSKYNLAPKLCGKLIKNLRKKFKLSRSEIGKYYHVWQVETGNSRISIDKLRKIVDNLSKIKGISNLKDFKKLIILTSYDFNLDVFSEIYDEIKSKLIEFDTNNRLCIDNGIVIDE
ncbi:MAG: hypothetical protein INQ03_06825 [Candidatus Heimdallarchaeota archaeon]|nr:hypothetical protein [Candidatus Heimdallarchaeota archaeon]